MKQIIIGVFIFTIAVSLAGCGNTTRNYSEQATNKSSNKSASSAKKMNRNTATEKMLEISDKLASGEITSKEAKKMQKEITSNMETQEDSMKRTNGNISEFNGMPSWAKSLGMSEPEGVTLVTSESRITKADGLYTDGFNATYKGNARTLMSEAKRIADGLHLNKEYETEDSFVASGKVGKYTVQINVQSNRNKIQMDYSATDLSSVK